MEVDTDSISDGSSDSRPEGIVGVGSLSLPPRSAIVPGQTYNTLRDKVEKLGEDLVALVPVFGPYPYFRYPYMDEEISSSVRRVWFMERNAHTSLIVLRTSDEDVVVPISLSEKNSPSVMLDVITTVISSHAPHLISIKDYSGQIDIKYLTVEAAKAISRPAGPTIAFVETSPGNVEFRSDFTESFTIANAWRFLYTRGISLVQRVSEAENGSLRLIHLGRAILHLIVSALEAVHEYKDSESVSYCTELHRLLDGLKNRIESKSYSKSDSDGDFNDLCDDRPGAVAVRRSYSLFSDLSRLDSDQGNDLSVFQSTSPDAMIPRIDSNSLNPRFLSLDASIPRKGFPRGVELISLSSVEDPPMMANARGPPPTFPGGSSSEYDRPMPMPDLDAPIVVQDQASSSNVTRFARDGGISASVDDVYLDTDGRLQEKKDVVSASAEIINAHRRARSFNPFPTTNVTNWDSKSPLPSPLPMGGHDQPHPPPFIQTQTLQPNPEQIASLASASSIDSSYYPLLHAQAGSFSSHEAYPPPSPAEELFSGLIQSLISSTSATPSSSFSSMVPAPIKFRQQGQRSEVNEAMLSKAFTPDSDYPNPGLRVLLELVRMSPFYLNEQMEPMLGTQDAEYLLEQVRRLVPNDPRFVSRFQEGGGSGPSAVGASAGVSGGNGNSSGDNGARDAQSIYMLFTESNRCLICGKQTDRSGRALGHVRSDIGHRPYHCSPRKFFSESLLYDHLKAQIVKQECHICHNVFRRGGMKRHMTSMHPEEPYNPGYDHDGNDTA
ncbi:hypothetical protein FRC17_009432 [Serendipita sp. 399]|nr:hypothetical protein FRC17_009432 [Serendipita sp. 399]